MIGGQEGAWGPPSTGKGHGIRPDPARSEESEDEEERVARELIENLGRIWQGLVASTNEQGIL